MSEKRFYHVSKRTLLSIAVFYTGLGCALALAGVLFWAMFVTYREENGGCPLRHSVSRR